MFKSKRLLISFFITSHYIVMILKEIYVEFVFVFFLLHVAVLINGTYFEWEFRVPILIIENITFRRKKKK